MLIGSKRKRRRGRTNERKYRRHHYGIDIMSLKKKSSFQISCNRKWAKREKRAFPNRY